VPAAPSPSLGQPAGVDGIFLPGALADRPVKRTLNAWQQGDLVRGVGLFWAGTADQDPITGLEVDPSAGHQWPVVPWDRVAADAAPGTAAAPWSSSWSIITSQTCDVVADGPGQRHPTVQVCPLVDLTPFGKGRIGEVARNEKVDLVLVPGVPDPGTWAADLRISVPVSKAVLLRQTRIPGFNDPAGAVAFAERVAAKYRRPALHDAITTGLVPRLRELVKSERDAGALWPDLIEQFRLLVTAGDRLQPTNVAIIAVLLEDKIDSANTEPLRAWRLQEKTRLTRASGTITLAPIRFQSLAKLSVRDYRESDPLRIPELHQPVFW
jgi:hypothetical protein